MTRGCVTACAALLALGVVSRADEPPMPGRLPVALPRANEAVQAPPAPTTPPTLTPAARNQVERLPVEPGTAQERFWLSADYLLWSVQSNGTPPLVVRDAPGTARTAVGVPGTPGQQVLFGGSGRNGELRSGFRVSGGVWLDRDQNLALGGEYFYTGPSNDGAAFTTPGDTPLSRPFFNVRTGRPDAELVVFPGVLSGSVAVTSRNTFSGAGAFLRCRWCDFDPCDPCAPNYRLDFLTGYRHFNLNDTLQIREDLLTVGANGPIAPGTRIVVTDRFRTENTFDGGLLALTGDMQSGRWSGDFRCGVSLGNLHRVLTIDGNTVVTGPGQTPNTRTGGLLAQTSNIGRYTSDTFTAVPEIGLNAGYQITSGLRVHVGYTLFYMPNTWRAGDQIDLGVDPNQLAGARTPFGRPAARLASTGAAVQGLNVGLLLRY